MYACMVVQATRWEAGMLMLEGTGCVTAVSTTASPSTATTGDETTTLLTSVQQSHAGQDEGNNQGLRGYVVLDGQAFTVKDSEDGRYEVQYTAPAGVGVYHLHIITGMRIASQ